MYCNVLHMDYTYELVGSFSWRVIVGKSIADEEKEEEHDEYRS